MSNAHRFSVVVASFRDLGLLGQCLDSLRPQCAAHDAELIVARRPGDAAGALERVAHGTRIVHAPEGADIPILRGCGLAAARGDWAALTEDHCVADAGWLMAFDAAATAPGTPNGPAVLGGSMGNAHRDRVTDAGAFFSEYGFFGARGTPEGTGVPLVTGANVAYSATVVKRVAEWAQSGAWENVIHERLFAAGERFVLVPGARIRQNLTYGFAAFCRDRYEHGLGFARTRAQQLPISKRLVLAGASPILPFVLASRIARAVDADEQPYFSRALPATLAFLGAWSLGEMIGYIRGS